MSNACMKSAPTGLTLGLAAALVAGCATTPSAPPPTMELQAAESSIVGAERIGATQYARQELLIAREKLEVGRRATHEGRMALAKRAAEQAQADAELATARTQTAIAREEADKIKREIP